jgi:hypothetical protein
MKKFYRTTITVTVLSESHDGAPDFNGINMYEVLGQDVSCAFNCNTEEIDGPMMARELLDQNSDPEIFGLEDVEPVSQEFLEALEELEELEAEFSAAGGRGFDLANRIDELRAFLEGEDN